MTGVQTCALPIWWEVAGGLCRSGLTAPQHLSSPRLVRFLPAGHLQGSAEPHSQAWCSLPHALLASGFAAVSLARLGCSGVSTRPEVSHRIFTSPQEGTRVGGQWAEELSLWPAWRPLIKDSSDSDSNDGHHPLCASCLRGHVSSFG